MNNDTWHMKMALEEAENAFRNDEVPVGAVVVDESGKLLSRSYNLKEKNNNPCQHAEVLALEGAAKELNNWRLNGCTLYVTLEPCVMCLGAMIQARISRLVFGAYDPKGGSLSLNYNFYNDSRLNHNFDVMGGILHFKSSKILSDFFKQRRNSYNRLKY